MKSSFDSLLLVLCCVAALGGCASLMSQATSGLSSNVTAAILNQDDPETVRDGAPAFLLMLDSFVEGAPDDVGTLGTAAELYAAYGVLFVADPERAGKLTTRSLAYAERGLCASNRKACGMDGLPYSDYRDRLAKLGARDIESLYTYSLAWFAYIKVHAADMRALAKLPRAEAALKRVQTLDPDFNRTEVEHYLGVLSTIRPPALGGDFDGGRRHFENALQASGGRNLAVKVDFARYYARTLYERELHDRLLEEVLDADPVQQDLTLFNVLAQREARELLDSADEYF